MALARLSITVFAILSLGFLSPAPAHAASPIPWVADGADSSSAEAQALVQWVVAQPQVQTRFAGARTRLLRMGIDRPKGREGTYRRATLFFRNYDLGIVHRVYLKLDTAEIAIEDLTSLVQPSREEIKAAWDIIRADSALQSLFDDPAIVPSGGFYDRSHVRGDPCSRDVCLLIEFARRRPGQGFAKRVVVNMSRETIANSDFHTPEPTQRGSRLSAKGLD